MTPPAAGHRIRLRGPWKIARCDDSGQPIGPVEVLRHPEEWPGVVENSQAGRVRLSRTFHAPTNVGALESVLVVLTGVRGEGEVWLNDHMLGRFTSDETSPEFAIPFVLPFTNELMISVAFPCPTASAPHVGVYDVVALEIRQRAELESPVARSIFP